ncbi:nucleophile aminohydrolase [Vararia minispora EC-137]|uniref:Nucleophile aminohydrolase n=1 Tax=Vararia minispora EC-137 TaxID=1314806 RepID=A0ACB8Q9B9_9AGAM|nr:nucleophile aminohydrolase [Vararia minispora EC-137]
MEVPYNPPPSFWLIAAHAGAGLHPPDTHAPVRKTLRTALSAVEHLTSSDSRIDSLSVTARILSELEAAEPLNAGYGSNLTLSGTVECDAALMDASDGAFGAVGALCGVRSPVLAARAVLDAWRTRMDDPLDRVMPLTLVGEGARSFAKDRGVEICEPSSLVSTRALQDWRFWKEKWENMKEEETDQLNSLRKTLRAQQDTVGAIVLDSTYNMTAGVSSGGLLLKAPGRVGEAAIYGAGCWADDRIACSITGQGELIIRSSVAKMIAEAVENSPGEDDMHDILKHVLIDKFYKKWKAYGEPQPDIGVLVLRKQFDSTKARLWCAFTTPSMAIGYATTEHPKPKAVILKNLTHTYEDSNRPPFFITGISP